MISFWSRSFDGDDWVDSETRSSFDSKEEAEKEFDLVLATADRSIISATLSEVSENKMKVLRYHDFTYSKKG